MPCVSLSRLSIRLLSVIVLFCAMLSPASSVHAANRDKALEASLRELLKSHPELVLDVLREHSETVLEIAQQGNIIRKRKAMLAQWKQDALRPKDLDVDGRAFRGKQSAPVTIVGYSDFTCPYCRQAETVVSQLLKKYDGLLRYTFKALPKDDPFSVTAAKYSTAAFTLDPEKGWAFFDDLFNEMDRFERESEGYLKELATRHGYDFRKLKTEAGSARVQERLDQDRNEADRLGISGTPHFLVDDLIVRGAVSKDLFEEAVDMALAAKTGKK